MRRCWFGLRYYLSWLLFAILALLVNGLCLPLLALPGRDARARLARQLIRRALQLWLSWLHLSRTVEVRWAGGKPVALRGGTVYIANHPTLIDATLILPLLPDAICIFKPQLLHNPLIAPAALAAGYLSSRRSDTLRAATAHVKRGGSLLIFPEGTRTRQGRHLNPMRPGFGLIAQRAGAPVHILRLRSSAALQARGQSWWHLPGQALWVELRLGETVPAATNLDPRSVVRSVEQRLRADLEAVSL